MSKDKNFEKFLNQEFTKQMQDWLDYAVEHHKDRKFKTQQTDRIDTTPNIGYNPIGNQTFKGPMGTHGLSSKASSAAWFNTWDLYKAWVEDYKARNPSKGKYSTRIFLHYNEAIPELHLLLDYLEGVVDLEDIARDTIHSYLND